MRILLYPGYCYLEHSETFIYRQLKELSKNHDVLTLSTVAKNISLYPKAGELKFRKYNLIDRIYVKLFTQKYGVRYDFPPFKKQFFIREIKRFKPDVIHAHFGSNGIEILPIAIKMGIPLFTTLHGIDASEFLNDTNYRKRIIDLSNVSTILTVSAIMRQEIINIGANPSNIFVNRIGIPVDEFDFSLRIPIRDKLREKQEIIFLQISRFTEKKGHQFTVRAFAKFLGKHPNLSVRLLLGGDGPLLHNTIQLVNELGIANQVEFIGKVAHHKVKEYLQNADVFLHHSITTKNDDKEGIPTVIMEAMATGLPVLSSKHAGIPELVLDGITGFLVEEKDIDSYVLCMEKIIEADTEKMALECRKHIENNFNTRRQVAELVKFFEKRIAQKSRK